VRRRCVAARRAGREVEGEVEGGEEDVVLLLENVIRDDASLSNSMASESVPTSRTIVYWVFSVIS
jgi:hypothetical protein